MIKNKKNKLIKKKINNNTAVEVGGYPQSAERTGRAASQNLSQRLIQPHSSNCGYPPDIWRFEVGP